MSVEGPIEPRRPQIHQTIEKKKKNPDHLLIDGKIAEVLKGKRIRLDKMIPNCYVHIHLLCA